MLGQMLSCCCCPGNSISSSYDVLAPGRRGRKTAARSAVLVQLREREIPVSGALAAVSSFRLYGTTVQCVLCCTVCASGLVVVRDVSDGASALAAFALAVGPLLHCCCCWIDGACFATHTDRRQARRQAGKQG